MIKNTSYDNGFKAKVSLETMRGNITVAEIATHYNVASSLVSKQKSELIANASNAFGVKIVKFSLPAYFSAVIQYF